ncbi:MAG: TM2 domain-containing protein [Gemmatimonadota bacterium]|nr:TM2 domain-containing protein [Gemmatimonadota bacterium]
MTDESDISERSRAVALVIGALTGWVGGHRFYVGKPGTGLLQMFTLGGFGVWWLYDMVLVGFGVFRDGEDKRVARWMEGDMVAGSLGKDKISEEVLDELEILREEVQELSERVDFAERLLAKQDEPQRRLIPPE